MNQVSRNEELLNTARDCFHFVTKFFEPISVSAAYIYHSALELSPLSSIIRRLYYHRGLAASESGKSIARPYPLCGRALVALRLILLSSTLTL